jgi:hypothetical protein
MLNVKYGKRGGFGPNLVASEHDEWRRHRRICNVSGRGELEREE